MNTHQNSSSLVIHFSSLTKEDLTTVLPDLFPQITHQIASKVSSLVNFYDYLSVETKYLCLKVKRDENVIVQNNLITK
jgi:hypothetical protein